MKKVIATAVYILINIGSTCYASQAEQRTKNEKIKKKFKTEQQRKKKEKKREVQDNTSKSMFATYVQPVRKHNANNSQ